MDRWEGVFAILMSPYTKRGSIDGNAVRSSIDFVLEKGVRGLVVLGSTGEFPYIQMKDKKKLIDVAVDHANGRAPVVAGSSAFGTEDVLELSKYAQDAGADGLMVNVPIYYGLEDQSIINHYETLTSKTDCRILLYNFPATTHYEMKPEMVVRLAELEKVVGIKESISDLKQIRAVIKGVKKPFSTFLGGSRILLDVLKLGGAGCADPNADVLPEYVVAVYDAYRSGDLAKAEDAQCRLNSLASIFEPGGGATHAAIKEAMRARGIPIESIVKQPLPQLSEEQKRQIHERVESAGLAKDI
jgi:4-hydroxy-tetrahydrodipicolinate synthase